MVVVILGLLAAWIIVYKYEKVNLWILGVAKKCVKSAKEAKVEQDYVKRSNLLAFTSYIDQILLIKNEYESNPENARANLLYIPKEMYSKMLIDQTIDGGKIFGMEIRVTDEKEIKIGHKINPKQWDN